MKLRVLWLALRQYRSVSKTMYVVRALQQLKEKMYGQSGERKVVYRDGKYWLSMYLPPYPSSNFDRFVLSEFNHILPHKGPVNQLQQLTFAITTHCPLQCEHCFEWDNLNKPETYTRPELESMLDQLQAEGLGQVSLSGGEPMVRYNEMLQLLRHGNGSTSWWMFTSGFGFTVEKAKALKEAGLSGIIVSIDHYDAALHDAFRHYPGAFYNAVAALRYARAAGLVTAASVCITRENCHDAFLEAYIRHAPEWGADFVQLLEARAAGHYAHKEVELTADQQQLLEHFYLRMNHDPTYQDAIPLVYHGFHQRQVGCMMGGNRSCYIDSAGMVQSCPFCHSHDFRVQEWLAQPAGLRSRITGCPLYPALQEDAASHTLRAESFASAGT